MGPHPSMGPYWSQTDKDTLAAYSTILESALVLGHDRMKWSRIGSEMQTIEPSGPLSDWSSEPCVHYEDERATSMIDEDEAVKRLRSLTNSERLSELAEASDSRMEIDEIVNAVLGEAESDGTGVTGRSFPEQQRTLSLSQMVIGILAVKKWREVWV